MASAKKFYYVGVFDSDREIRLITQVNKLDKTWSYSVDETPVAMTKSDANDLVCGLIANFTPAIIVESWVELKTNFGSEAWH